MSEDKIAQAVRTLQEAGYAVVLLSYKECEEVGPDGLADHMVKRCWDAIQEAALAQEEGQC